MTLPSPSPPTVTKVVERIRLVIELQGSPHSALLRTLATLHRRRFRVVWLRYSAGGCAADELHVVVEGPASHAHCLEAWLGALVEVRTVESRSGSFPM